MIFFPAQTKNLSSSLEYLPYFSDHLQPSSASSELPHKPGEKQQCEVVYLRDTGIIFAKKSMRRVVIPMSPTFLSVLSAMLRVLSLSFCLTRSANASLSSMSCNRSRSSFSHSSSSSSSFLTDWPELTLMLGKLNASNCCFFTKFRIDLNFLLLV